MLPNVYCFWTGTNLMSDARKRSIEQLKNTVELNLILVTPDNLDEYILKEHPLHESYQYLSETHKSDYLRTYFMNFHGGGYTDLKPATSSWKKAYDELCASEFHWMAGFKEIGPSGVAYLPYRDKWEEMVGTSAFMCKPNTPLTNEWYNSMIKVLDTKLEELKLHPSTFPQDCTESGTGYPIAWCEILSVVAHRFFYDYREHVFRSLPPPDFTWGYR